MRSGLLPRLQDFLFIVVLIGALATGSRMLNTDSDLGRHLTLGAYILSSHQIPTHDILSFTKAGDPRPPYEWLAQVLLAVAYRILNLDGVVLFTSIVIAAAFSLVYLDGLRRSGTPIAALLTTAWAAIASSLHWLARPHIFSFVFFALWLYLLERLRRGEPTQIWLFSALMLLWSNAHGGFIYGFLALGVYCAGWLWEALRGTVQHQIGKGLLTISVTSALTSVLTPDLWHNWDAVLNNRSSYVLSRTVETMPLQVNTPGVWPFLAMLFLVSILLLGRHFRVPASHLLLLTVLAVASFAMVRNIPLFAIAAAPMLTEWASEALAALPVWQRIEGRFLEMEAGFKPFLWLGVAVLFAFSLFAYRDIGLRSPLYQFRPDVFPVQASSWVKAHAQPGNTFNDFNWGGYLLYRLWPAQRVFIDSQSDFYGEALTRQAASIAAGGSGWEDSLDRFGVTRIFIPRNAGLAAAASSSLHWTIAYEDAIAIVLDRK